MKRALYLAAMIAPMIGLWYAMKWIVYDTVENFGFGFVSGMAFIVVLLVIVEKLGLYGMYDLRHGYWTPHRRD